MGRGGGWALGILYRLYQEYFKTVKISQLQSNVDCIVFMVFSVDSKPVNTTRRYLWRQYDRQQPHPLPYPFLPDGNINKHALYCVSVQFLSFKCRINRTLSKYKNYNVGWCTRDGWFLWVSGQAPDV